MADRIPGINFTGPVVPNLDSDTYPSHYAKYGKGGWRSVSTLADRNAIPVERREAGMSVYVTSESKLYILQNDLTTWNEFESGSADAIRKTSDFSTFEPLFDNEIVQYIGETNQNYTHGYFYAATPHIEHETTVTFTPHEEVETVVTIFQEDFTTFVETWCEGRPFTAEEVTHGDIGYLDSSSYSMTIFTADDQFAYSSFSITDLETAGFTFTPYLDARQGVDFVCEINKEVKSYIYDQTNVQPDLAVKIHNRVQEIVNGAVDLSVIEQVSDLSLGAFPRDDGRIVQYIGTNTVDEYTHEEYINGYFYKCVQEMITPGLGEAVWRRIAVQPQGATGWGSIVGTLSDQTDLQAALDGKIDHYEVMPEASEELLDKIVQYIGETDSNYTNGYFYKCVDDIDIESGDESGDESGIVFTYKWEQINIQPQTDLVWGNISGTLANQTDLSGALKDLQDQIDVLKSRGRYLSTWDMQEGLPDTNPEHLPYELQSGDYYLVSHIADKEHLNIEQTSGDQLNNLQVSFDTFVNKVEPDPELDSTYTFLYDTDHWSLDGITIENISEYGITFEGTPVDTDEIEVTYICAKTNKRPDVVWEDNKPYYTGVASTVVETEEVGVTDTYIFDGETWILLSNAQREITFASLAGSPYDNTELSEALNDKLDTTSETSKVYGTDDQGEQTLYDINEFGKIDNVKIHGNVQTIENKAVDLSVVEQCDQTTMPVPSADYLGRIVQYVGPNGLVSGYVHGYYYECQSVTTESYIELEVIKQPDTQLETVICDKDLLEANQGSSRDFSWDFVSHGGWNEWYLDDEHIDLNDWGIAYEGEPSENDEIYLEYYKARTRYQWVQINVQPEVDVSNKLDKTTEASKVYGTTDQGVQTLYDVSSFGLVNDVQLNGVSVVTDKVANIEPEALDVGYTNSAVSSITTVKDALDNLMNIHYYVEPSFSTFTTDKSGSYERQPSAIEDITFSWTLNKKPESGDVLKITTGQNGTGDLIYDIMANEPASKWKSGTYELSDFTTTNTNKTYYIYYKDNHSTVPTGKSSSASKSTSITFFIKKYYGASELENPTAAQIRALTNATSSKALASTTFNFGTGKYWYYCIPKETDTGTALVFSIGPAGSEALQSGNYFIYEVNDFTNAQGYTVPLRVYKFKKTPAGQPDMLTGTANVKVA